MYYQTLSLNLEKKKQFIFTIKILLFYYSVNQYQLLYIPALNGEGTRTSLGNRHVID